MTPRPSKPTGPEITPPPEVGTPKIVPGVQDHNFHTQAVFEIHKQVGKLESGLANIEGRLTTVETKLDQVRSEVASLNTTISTVKPLLVWVCRGLLAFLAFGLTVLGMWLKHHYGW